MRLVQFLGGLALAAAPGLDVEATAALVMQTIFGALRLRALGPGLELTPIGSERIYAFCLRALEN